MQFQTFFKLSKVLKTPNINSKINKKQVNHYILKMYSFPVLRFNYYCIVFLIPVTSSVII